MNDFQITAVVVCDDVRKEISNKDILVGVYPSGITVGFLPGTVNLCFWMAIQPKKTGVLSIQLKVELPGQTNPAMMKMSTQVVNIVDGFSVATPQIPCLITKEGDMKLSVRSSDQQKWELAKKIRLTCNPKLLAVPPPQSSLSGNI